MTVFLLAGALAIGCLLAIQASVNPQLAKAVGTPYGGATVQLWFAAGLLAILAAAVGAFGAFGLLGSVPVWYLVGGLASPLYITAGILLFPRMGALAAGGLFVTGQILASIAVDVFGLLGVDRQPVSVGIVAGGAAVLAGITLIVRGQQAATRTPVPAAASSGPPSPQETTAPPAPPAAPPPAPARSAPGWIVLGLLAGAVLPLQGAINAQLSGAWADPVAVALWSFLVAAAAITVVLVVLRATGKTASPQLGGVRAMPWWAWLGGACAVAYVSGTFLLIPALGAAVTVALTVTGQQLAAAAIDTSGAFRLPRRPITALRGLGLLLLVAGSALVQLL